MSAAAEAATPRTVRPVVPRLPPPPVVVVPPVPLPPEVLPLPPPDVEPLLVPPVDVPPPVSPPLPPSSPSPSVSTGSWPTKATGTLTSCERSPDRVWSARVARTHSALKQSVYSSFASTVSSTSNVPPSSYGIANSSP
ncbi:hypothetical protein PV367_33200 [Streptomyces europaeiscabiei]|uniref:Uncharacterized protein n=1 Tax=Streptomyces europaeiscabiei TaxID=146819 RepID=A0AAJ2PVK4_9ACTN|nr:hypothetical protein [Streptomyces europaeiscabiei]MDX3134539.1 hypothetical protein [Streptomyces europaeiscabiei]